MSIQNFPKIPKITLIKPCDQAKDTKNQKYTFLLCKVEVLIECYSSRKHKKQPILIKLSNKLPP